MNMQLELPIAQLATALPANTPLLIDIGCGKNPKEGFAGLDAIDFGQRYVHDVRNGLGLFADNSVDEINSSHFVEHLTWPERVIFFNELYRVMKPGARAQIVTPHWSHACFYGDPTHKEPISEWYVNYLLKSWRDTQAPHAPYTCDFDFIIAGSWDARLHGRNPEFVQAQMNTAINGWRDLIVTLTKRSS